MTVPCSTTHCNSTLQKTYSTVQYGNEWISIVQTETVYNIIYIVQYHSVSSETMYTIILYCILKPCHYRTLCFSKPGTIHYFVEVMHRLQTHHRTCCQCVLTTKCTIYLREDTKELHNIANNTLLQQ